jgi:Zn-dependent protease
MTAPTNTLPDALPARPISPVALVLLLAWAGTGAGLSAWEPLRGPLTFVFVLIGWVLSVMAHEFGHAVVAYKGGDHTVAAKGYLTLDPLRYMDSATSLIIPLLVLAIGGIGLPGGAVYLRQDLMRGPLWRSAASLAGPAGTLAMLLLLSGAVALLRMLAPAAEPLTAALAFLAFLQATALIINLLPIPGLDGYGALRPFLPQGVAAVLGKFEPVLFLGFIALLFVSPLANGLLFGSAFGLAAAAGVPGEPLAAGFDAFRFWK